MGFQGVLEERVIVGGDGEREIEFRETSQDRRRSFAGGYLVADALDQGLTAFPGFEFKMHRHAREFAWTGLWVVLSVVALDPECFRKIATEEGASALV